MKVSIVTISFNQARYLNDAIRSVIEQDYDDIEYIVVDPGSTDGSRDIIDGYADKISHVVFDKDQGPADGLNKGFARATGDIYGFINADDWLYPTCVSTIVTGFRKRPHLDVLSGHLDVVTGDKRHKRRMYSDEFTAKAYAYRACSVAQQATFFRADAFHRAGGFNTTNSLAWDGELWLSMAEAGARFGVVNASLAAWRIYPGTLSNEGHHGWEFSEFESEIFQRVMRRPWRRLDALRRLIYVARRYAKEPRSLHQRIVKGPIK